MAYSDEDILDLYDDLCTIGAAVTPAEEAEALYKTFNVYSEEHIPPSRILWSNQVCEELIRFLQAKSIPITYLLKWRSYHSPNPILRQSLVQCVYPMHKGIVIHKGLSLNDFILAKGWSKAEVEVFDTPEELDAAVAAAELERQKD
jgi:hypothetical protein